MNGLTPSSPDIQAIPVNECHEPLVDLTQCSDLRVGPPPECPETEPDYCWARQGVRDRLIQAQALLPEGIYLRLYEGYRSAAVQQMLFVNHLAQVKQDQPDLSDQQAYVKATQLVSAPTRLDGTINTPPHSTGAAMDVELVDERGTVLDFGMEIADWSRVPPTLCESDCAGLSEHAQHNRQHLLDVMQRVGFVNYPQEWWHFSYGDQFWAYTTGQPSAIYGRVNGG